MVGSRKRHTYNSQCHHRRRIVCVLLALQSVHFHFSYNRNNRSINVLAYTNCILKYACNENIKRKKLTGQETVVCPDLCQKNLSQSHVVLLLGRLPRSAYSVLVQYDIMRNYSRYGIILATSYRAIRAVFTPSVSSAHLSSMFLSFRLLPTTSCPLH